ncbi:MAG TPA: restriction endonuclease subunit S, partial [Bacteroidales bacterium]|nr:restriction endonuclease subunit S [Bacteroidales bacterium]
MNRIKQLIEELCPEGVEFKELGEVAYILNGYAFKSKLYSKDGVRVIRISDVQKGRISGESLIFYPIQTLNEIENYLLYENDLVMSLTGNVGRVAIISNKHLPAGLNQRVACIRVIDNNKVLIRFLFHFFDQNEFERDAMNSSSGAGQKNMSTIWLSNYKIPIPPLPIQQEIVRILDTFTALDGSLQAELEARRKQYEHYRNQLLNFEGKEVEWKTLGEIGNIQRGVRVVRNQLLESGKYPVYQNSMKPLGYFDKSNYKANTTFIISAGAAGDIGYSDVDFWAADDCFLCLCPDNLNSKFLYYFLLCNQNYLYSRVRRASVPRLSREVVEKIKIPLPPLTEQERIVGILDKFDALVSSTGSATGGIPAEIAARRKQY